MRWIVRPRWATWVGVGMALTLPVLVAAQEAAQCREWLSAAALNLATTCSLAEPGSLCAASQPLTLMPDDVELPDEPGSALPLAGLESVSLGGVSVDEESFALATIRPENARIDGSLLLIAVGEVAIENQGSVDAAEAAVSARVTHASGANVRSDPSPNVDVIGTLRQGEIILATGISGDSRWIRIVPPFAPIGWVSADALDLGGGTVPLAGSTNPQPNLFAPFQAFNLAVETDDPPGCGNLPPSGVVAQTTAESMPYPLRVNEVDVTIAPGSTVFLRAWLDARLSIDVLEGSVTLPGLSGLNVSAGDGVTLALPLADDAITPAGYVYNTLARLPVEFLPRPIFVPLDFERLLTDPVEGNDPMSGIAPSAACTIGAIDGAVNLRERPDPSARIRHVMLQTQTARPDGRTEGTDGAIWWRLAENIWAASAAVQGAGDCASVPPVAARW